MSQEFLAKVEDITITRDDLLSVLQSLPREQGMQANTFEGRKLLLEEMVAAEMFYLEAKADGLETDAEYVKAVERAAKTLLQQFAVQKTIREATVEPEAIAAYYESNKDQFVSEPEVKAKHILVEDAAQAEAIEAEIKAGLSFEEAAQKYSTCPSKERGGDLGFFSRGRMVPEFEAVAFELELGEMSSPVQTQFGYHLIVVDEKKEAGTQSLEAVSQEISNQLLQQAQRAKYDSKVTDLKTQYAYELNEDLLK